MTSAKTTNNKNANTSAASKANDLKTNDKSNEKFVFGTMNYILMGIGIVLLILGYILLSGGGSDDPNVFNAEMFNARRLVVAPIVITAGLIVEICAIMFRNKKKNSAE